MSDRFLRRYGATSIEGGDQVLEPIASTLMVALGAPARRTDGFERCADLGSRRTGRDCFICKKSSFDHTSAFVDSHTSSVVVEPVIETLPAQD